MVTVLFVLAAGDSSTAYTGGAVVGAVLAIAAAFGSLWNTKYSATAKRRESENATIQTGQSAILQGLEYSERSNKELRAEMTLANDKIDALQIENRELRAYEAECQRRIEALMVQIRGLQGGS